MHPLLVFTIAVISIALMLARPRNLPEWVPTCSGALLLLCLRQLTLRTFGAALGKGTDVYCFLTGMMLLAELSRTNGVFDWLASHAVHRAQGSRVRLFTLIYGIGVLVTVFLSNDATAVVLTPAVLAAVKRAKADPLPCLFACAMVANAASFVLPISNPANLVIFHQSLPALFRWLGMFVLPSAVSIALTWLGLRWYFRKSLRGDQPDSSTEATNLSPSGRVVVWCLAGVSAVLLIASSLGLDLGVPTLISAIAAAALLSIRNRRNPAPLLRRISWSVLPLVAALFVLVEAVEQAGALQLAQNSLLRAAHLAPLTASLITALFAGFATNAVNNLPLGLLAGHAITAVHVQGLLVRSIAIAIDLGPNLSVTGSLATILWLVAIRREQLNVTAWQFLKAGLFIMPPALIAAVAAAWLTTSH